MFFNTMVVAQDNESGSPSSPSASHDAAADDADARDANGATVSRQSANYTTEAFLDPFSATLCAEFLGLQKHSPKNVAGCDVPGFAMTYLPQEQRTIHEAKLTANTVYKDRFFRVGKKHVFQENMYTEKRLSTCTWLVFNCSTYEMS